MENKPQNHLTPRPIGPRNAPAPSEDETDISKGEKKSWCAKNLSNLFPICNKPPHSFKVAFRVFWTNVFPQDRQRSLTEGLNQARPRIKKCWNVIKFFSLFVHLLTCASLLVCFLFCFDFFFSTFYKSGPHYQWLWTTPRTHEADIHNNRGRPHRCGGKTVTGETIIIIKKMLGLFRVSEKKKKILLTIVLSTGHRWNTKALSQTALHTLGTVNEKTKI